jgi:hypothetical protein
MEETVNEHYRQLLKLEEPWRVTTMTIEKQLTKMLYKKLGNASFWADQLERVLGGVPIKKRHIARAVINGTWVQFFDRLRPHSC